MSYSSEFFYRSDPDSPTKFYHITEDMISRIKGLKASISNRSGYYDTMLQWVASDNMHLSIKDLNEVYPAMQFIAMIGQIKPEFIKKYNVKEYHIALLRRLYLDWEDDGYDGGALSQPHTIAISMGFKRPFGNSYVAGDVRNEMIKSGDVGAIQRDDDENSDTTEEEKVLVEFVDILEKFFQEGFNLTTTAFEQLKFSGFSDRKSAWDAEYRLHSYMYDWKPAVSFIRDEKIKKILN